jgi:hypothetical protein
LLQIRGTSIRNVTDDRGRFILWGVPAGTRTLDVEMIGYATRSETITAVGGRTLELDVQLSTRPIELDPISVEVRSDWLERSGFYERMEDPGLGGAYLERGEIERRAIATLRDMFTGLPSVRVEYRGPGRTIITLRRTVGSDTGLGCTPLFYFDGARIVRDIDFIEPSMVEAMEVYTGSNAPIGYGNSCGAILFWSRSG